MKSFQTDASISYWVQTHFRTVFHSADNDLKHLLIEITRVSSVARFLPMFPTSVSICHHRGGGWDVHPFVRGGSWRRITSLYSISPLDTSNPRIVLNKSSSGRTYGVICFCWCVWSFRVRASQLGFAEECGWGKGWRLRDFTADIFLHEVWCLDGLLSVVMGVEWNLSSFRWKLKMFWMLTICFHLWFIPTPLNWVNWLFSYLLDHRFSSTLFTLLFIHEKIKKLVGIIIEKLKKCKI